MVFIAVSLFFTDNEIAGINHLMNLRILLVFLLCDESERSSQFMVCFNSEYVMAVVVIH